MPGPAQRAIDDGFSRGELEGFQNFIEEDRVVTSGWNIHAGSVVDSICGRKCSRMFQNVPLLRFAFAQINVFVVNANKMSLSVNFRRINQT